MDLNIALGDIVTVTGGNSIVATGTTVIAIDAAASGTVTVDRAITGISTAGDGAIFTFTRVTGVSTTTNTNTTFIIKANGDAVSNFTTTTEKDWYNSQKLGLTKGSDIAWLVPHQANKRIIDATAKLMQVPKDKIMMNISRYGNTTGGTIPLCLWDYESKLKKGDNLILAAFGGGFTWASIYVKWAYNPEN